MHNFCFCLMRAKIHVTSIARTSDQPSLQFQCSVLKGRLDKYLHSNCVRTSDRFFFFFRLLTSRLFLSPEHFWLIFYLGTERNTISSNFFHQTTLLVYLFFLKFRFASFCDALIAWVRSIFAQRKKGHLATVFGARFWISVDNPARVGVRAGRVRGADD